MTYLMLMLISVLNANSFGQSSEKSSGVIDLKMSKKKAEKPAEKPLEKNVSSTTFRMTKPVTTQVQPEVSKKISSPGTNMVEWLSPSLSSINTSNSSYTVKASISTEEDMLVVNVFLNGTFYRNIIVDGRSKRDLTIEEEFDLTLGNNSVKLEAITVSGKKIEDVVRINYDLSSARYYALIIAVEDYDDPTITDLSEPVNDADKFYAIISHRYTFNEEDITYLKNPTKADIIGTLHKMRNVVREEDNLLIYYAGHGYWDEEMMTGYWLPSDANSDNPVNWLPNTDLTNYLNVLKTKHTLLVADACFSGGIFKTMKAFNNLGSIEKLYKLPSRKAITSGTLKEVPDQSVFIEYLIKRLNENKDGYLSSEQLFSSLRTAVMNNSPNVPQYGTIQNVGDEGGDFVFILRD